MDVVVGCNLQQRPFLLRLAFMVLVVSSPHPVHSPCFIMTDWELYGQSAERGRQWFGYVQLPKSKELLKINYRTFDWLMRGSKLSQIILIWNTSSKKDERSFLQSNTIYKSFHFIKNNYTNHNVELLSQRREPFRSDGSCFFSNWILSILLNPKLEIADAGDAISRGGLR